MSQTDDDRRLGAKCRQSIPQIDAREAGPEAAEGWKGSSGGANVSARGGLCAWKERCAARADSDRCIYGSRRRTGWCVFSSVLLALCRDCAGEFVMLSRRVTMRIVRQHASCLGTSAQLLGYDYFTL